MGGRPFRRVASVGPRVSAQSEDEELERRRDEQDRLEAQIVRALESCGVPLVVRPEDIEIVRAEQSVPESDDYQGGKTSGADS